MTQFATLAQINAATPAENKSVYGVGKAGSTRRGMTGAHTHVIRSFEYRAFAGPVMMVEAVCAPSADVGATFDGTDTIAVTCAKCRAWLERVTASINARAEAP
jgi:hypothetical protein